MWVETDSDKSVAVVSKPRRTRIMGRVIAALLVMGFAASTASAATIIKLNLGDVGPDIAMNGGVLGTSNDGIAATTGNQNTAITYVGPLSGLTSITTNTASFTLANVTPVGAAVQVGTTAIQSFTGGTFSLYDPNNTLLLSGLVGNSTLTGVVGPPGTGALFSTTLTTPTGGTLASLIAPGSVALSISLSNVNGGAGFSISPVGGPGTLQNFVADATVQIDGNPVPEPASLSVLGLGAVALLRRRRR